MVWSESHPRRNSALLISTLAETLNDIDEGMKRIRDIIQDLRSFAYPDKVLRRDPVSISEIVETAMRFNAHDARDITIDVDVEEDHVVVGSRNQLIQVMVNLLSNAIKAVRSTCDQRPPRIEIASRIVEEQTRITVTDSGPGIDPEVLPKVFDPFFTTRDVGAGMGLGLSICHTIVNVHGGTISMQSEPGAWTRATLELPVAHVENTV